MYRYTFDFTLIMARKEYLSYEERKRFDSPPILTNMQRAIFIQLPDWAESYYGWNYLFGPKVKYDRVLLMTPYNIVNCNDILI